MNASLARSVLVRPVAICVGAAAAYALVPALRDGTLIFWITGLFAASGLVLWLLGRVARFARFVTLASPVVSLLGWGTLAVFTGGLQSALVAALFLEIALAAVTLGPRGVVWVASWAAAVLGLVYYAYGFSQGIPLLLLEVGFVGAIGGLGFAVARRRQAGEQALRVQREALGRRLDGLQRQLEDERVVSRVGENVARLAHGLKNAVHSLRGFVALIEPRLEGDSGARAALAGLRTAIDELEKLARMTLDEGAGSTSAEGDSGAGSPDGARTADLSRVVEEARTELAAASPEVEWSLREAPDAGGMRVALAEATLLELLVILMRNAVEAMEGKGQASVAIARHGDLAVLRIEDDGPGFAPEDLERIFQPGYTTKTQGSGFGLFLARRIVSDHGGSLRLEAGVPRGAVVHVEIPLAGEGAAGAVSAGD